MILPSDFDAETYYQINEDVRAAGEDAAEHYLRYGIKEGRRYQLGDLPSDFDAETYYQINKDVRAAGEDAAEHYLRYGIKEGRRYQLGDLPSDFDAETYYQINKDVRAAGEDAAEHYLRYGIKEGRRYQLGDLPSDFDAEAYYQINKDLRAAGVDATEHYLTYGIKEGRRYKRGPENVPPHWKTSRVEKIERIKPYFRTDMAWQDRDGVPDFLTDDLRRETRISDTDNVSANGYDENMLALIDKNPSGFVLDCGAGRKDRYFDNVINYEIVKYASTDVLGVGEHLPFVDGTFDAVISIAVLEHVRDPFRCANEISRVLKPGGELYCLIPFLQPLHGYPHHYFNASSQGIRRLFEDELTVTDVTVLDSMHPIWSLSWILQTWRRGVPDDARRTFDELQVKDLIADPQSYLGEAFCAQMTKETKLEIASATALTAIKHH